MVGFSMANLGKLAGSSPYRVNVNFIDSLECHSVIEMSHNM